MAFHEFRGQRGRSPQGGKAWTSQASDRDRASTFDQYGRPWIYVRDKHSGMPCSPYEPDGWSAPWLPDQGSDYFILNLDNTTELYINFRAIARDRRAVMKEYHAEACRYADQNNQPRPTPGKYSEAIVNAKGEPPRAYQWAVACEQGNPYALGFTDVVDTRLERYLEGPTRELDMVFEQEDFRPQGNAAKRVAKSSKRMKSFQELKAAVASGQSLADEVAADETEMAKMSAMPEHTLVTDDDEELLVDGELVPANQVDATDLEEVPEDEPIAEEEEEPSEADGQGLVPGLEDLDDEYDPSAMGGRTVHPSHQNRVAKRGRKPVPKRELKEFTREGRKSLADGATPVVGSPTSR